MKLEQHAKRAAIARSDLNILYGVIALLEGGTISANREATVSKIIKLCKAESARCLVDYDKNMVALGGDPMIYDRSGPRP